MKKRGKKKKQKARTVMPFDGRSMGGGKRARKPCDQQHDAPRKKKKGKEWRPAFPVLSGKEEKSGVNEASGKKKKKTGSRLAYFLFGFPGEERGQRTGSAPRSKEGKKEKRAANFSG